jgi:hypothetical protein
MRTHSAAADQRGTDLLNREGGLESTWHEDIGKPNPQTATGISVAADATLTVTLSDEPDCMLVAPST